MQSNGSTNALSAANESGKRSVFHADQWLAYFECNRDNRAAVRFPQGITVSPDLREPLLHSLQRFQIGETGAGQHLGEYARSIKNPIYEKCIDLFVKEEQAHAGVLAEMINAMDGTVISYHWSAFAFKCLRRMLGLKTEIFILLTAEIIGKVFYHSCSRKISDRQMSDGFSLLVVDEIAHLEFQTEFLANQLAHLPRPVRFGIALGFACVFYTSCLVFVADHRRTLSALNITSREFINECRSHFRKAKLRALGMH
jgi:hypothetical protein